MTKSRRVPKVLWRLFHNRARTLAETIVSLIPPPPSAVECRCKRRRCLGCSGEDAMSFLLRPKDPSDYRKLLTQCFVVVSDNAPPLSAVYPDRRWSQLEIVRRTIEMILCEKPTFPNAISSGYDKRSRSSAIVELLTCSAWSLLLRRVGDGVMFYLLKYTSIFLPLPRKTHHQVAGFSISNLCFKFSKNMAESEYQHPSLVLLGSQKKRKIIEIDSTSEKQQLNISSGDDIPSSSVSCVGCNDRSSTPYSRPWRKMRSQNSSHGDAETSGAGNANKKWTSSWDCQESSSQTSAKSMKRLRQFSWLRQRKRRLLSTQETYCQTPCTLCKKDSLSGRIQFASDTSFCILHGKMPLQCPCCLVLKALPKVTKKSQINRQSIFYKLECSLSVLPRKHILNSLKPNVSGANALFKNIFGISDANITARPMQCFHSNNCCLIGSTCLYHSLLKLLKILIRKARCCRHIKLLDKHCTILSLDQIVNQSNCSKFEGNQSETKSLLNEHARVKLDGKLPLEKVSDANRNPEATAIQFEPSKSCCLKKQVVSFIWAVCRSIVPPDLLGTPSNWRTLRRNISMFVQLRRFEKFSLKQCMHKLKTSKFPLISNKHSSCYLKNHVLKHSEGQNADMDQGFSEVNGATHVKHKILDRWIFWLFSCLVVPLVQANFFVTESEHGKQEVFYYRKSIWEKLMNGTITSLEDQSYCLLNDASIGKIISNRSFGFSRVRLLPKANGVRPLANLKASSRISIKQFSLKVPNCGLQRKLSLNPKSVKYDYFKSVNGVLRDLHVVLKGIQLKEPEKLGSSVFDYNDVYRKLCPFLAVLKSGLSTVPGVFIVVSDVSKAFDSVNQDKLLSVMKDIILNDDYLLKKSHQVVCTKKSLYVHQNLILAHQDISTTPAEFISLVPSCSSDSILINQEWSRNLRKKELLFNLNEHVKHNVLQLDKKFYLQNVGIPQGSVLSSLLCSFYYGHLETKVIFPFLEKTCEPSSEDAVVSSSPKYMLLRFIDDFIFISTSKEQAARFFSRLRRGFREYNCYMNEEKFGLNFDIGRVSGLQSNRVYVGEDGISFLRWSGLFINCCTLEVQADYTRYLNTHLSSTLTVCWQGKPGQHLKAKLCDYLRPKCHHIFYDSNINSAAVVRLNIYQSFLLCAMKFHCYVSELSNICRLHSDLYLEIIHRSLRYMHKLIKKRMHSRDLGSNFRPILQVDKREIEWLGLIAYTKVLKRKQSRYKELLSSLKVKMTAHQKMERLSSALKYAVDDSHSSVIWKIKY